MCRLGFPNQLETVYLTYAPRFLEYMCPMRGLQVHSVYYLSDILEGI